MDRQTELQLCGVHAIAYAVARTNLQTNQTVGFQQVKSELLVQMERKGSQKFLYYSSHTSNIWLSYHRKIWFQVGVHVHVQLKLAICANKQQ